MSEELNFNALLEQNAAEVHRPPPLPRGTYRCHVTKREQVSSSKKGTPGMEYTYKGWDPQADVDTESWGAFENHPTIDIASYSKTETFWITPKSMYRIKEFAVHCGLDPDSLGPMSAVIDACIGQSVMISIEQTPSSRPGDDSVYANITGFAQVPA